MDHIGIYVWTRRLCQTTIDYVGYHQSFDDCDRDGDGALVDAKYQCLEPGQPDSLVGIIYCMGTDVVCIGFKPGEQQFVYLFPVLGKEIIHQGDECTAKDDLTDQIKSFASVFVELVFILDS